MKRVIQCMFSVFKSKDEDKKTVFTECLCKLEQMEKELLKTPKIEKDGN